MVVPWIFSIKSKEGISFICLTVRKVRDNISPLFAPTDDCKSTLSHLDTNQEVQRTTLIVVMIPLLSKGDAYP